MVFLRLIVYNYFRIIFLHLLGAKIMLSTYNERDYFLKHLEKHIQKLRYELINVGMEEGFNDSNTVQLSQQLDYFILKYQQLTSSNFND